jgi:ABC-2 type transport system permease protein
MSSLTNSQVVAFILSLVVTLALSLVDKMLQVLPSGIASILEYLGAEYHYERIARGVIDTRDLIYYASLVLLGLYFAARALQRRF